MSDGFKFCFNSIQPGVLIKYALLFPFNMISELPQCITLMTLITDPVRFPSLSLFHRFSDELRGNRIHVILLNIRSKLCDDD